MRQYETAFLIDPQLPEEDTEKLIQEMASVVSRKKGKMLEIEKWGKRKLAYPIKKLDEAFYVFFHYEGEPAIPFELERRFKQTEPVLRYMTLKKEIEEEEKLKKRTVKKTMEKQKEKEEKEEPAEEKEEPAEEPEEKEPEGIEEAPLPETKEKEE